MQTERWEEIKGLLDDALERSPEDRDSWLQARCDGDSALLDEIRSLLRQQERAPLLEGPATDRVAHVLREHRAEAGIGRQVGKFTVTGLLGYGGMGMVYRAQQDHPQREVALKIIPAGAHASPYQLKLFGREVQSLARMQHPGIAALYEAGCDEDGQHYFAMELVQGLPLMDYANDRRLDLRARLSLFAKIGDAVHYAHQKGVIHRDIKPTNILVTEGDQPKLLDFGLAKLLEHDSATVTTALGKVHGTLSYMSPEQACGLSAEIDVRSDVYSLGILLFELLTQRRPLELTGRTVPSAIEIICNETPQKAGAIAPALRGDLETIIAKALEKEPQRRYQSAHALAEDVQRFLAAQPITARPSSATYQLRKFAARHRLPVAFAVTLALVISISAVGAAVLSIRLERERDQALAAKSSESEARRSAEQVVGFLVRLFEHADPEAEERSVPTVHELLEAGEARVQTELASQPLVQARLMTALGSVFLALGEYDRARELLESGLSTRERELGKDHIDVAESLIHLNELLVCTGDYDRGYESARRALEIHRKTYGEDHPRYADTLDFLGSNRFYADDFAKAAEYFKECLAKRTKIYGDQDLRVADALQNLGSTMAKLNAPNEAEPLLQRALSIQQDLHAGALKIVLTRDALAHVVYARGDYLGTERLLKEEFDFAVENLHENHPSVAWVLDNYATLVRRNHGPEQVEPLYREAIARYRAARGNEHILLSRELMALGLIRKELNDLVEAESLLDEALKIRRLRLGGQHRDVAASARELGLVIETSGRFEQAAVLLRESFSIYSTALGPEDANTVAVAKDLEKLYGDWNQPEEAANWRSKLSPMTAVTVESE